MMPPLLALTAANAYAMLGRLCAYGATWITTLAQRSTQNGAQGGANPASADPVTNFVRVLRAMRWANTLADFLAGRFRLTPVRTRTAIVHDQPDAASIARYDEREDDDDERFSMGPDPAVVRALRTQPLGKIIARICRDLGLPSTHELWPAGLVAITQTFAEWIAQPPPQAAPPATPLPSPRPCAEPSMQSDHPPPPIRPPPSRPDGND